MREVVWQLSSNVVVAQSHYQYLVTPFQRQDAYICAHLLIFTFPHEQVSLKWSYERADNDLVFLSHSPSDLYGLLVVSATVVRMVRHRWWFRWSVVGSDGPPLDVSSSSCRWSVHCRRRRHHLISFNHFQRTILIMS